MINRDKTHRDQIKRWAEFVKHNPDKWKKPHSEFIDSQFIMARRFFETLAREPNGEERVKELRMLRINKRN